MECVVYAAHSFCIEKHTHKNAFIYCGGNYPRSKVAYGRGQVLCCGSIPQSSTFAVSVNENRGGAYAILCAWAFIYYTEGSEI